MTTAHKTPENKGIMFNVEPILGEHFTERLPVVPHLKPFYSLFLVGYLWDGHQSSPAEALLPNGLVSYKRQQ